MLVRRNVHSLEFLDRSGNLWCLTFITVELACNDYKKVVENFISFPENLVSGLLDVHNSNYDQNM
jgi:hypothetical protein